MNYGLNRQDNGANVQAGTYDQYLLKNGQSTILNKYFSNSQAAPSNSNTVTQLNQFQ